MARTGTGKKAFAFLPVLDAPRSSGMLSPSGHLKTANFPRLVAEPLREPAVIRGDSRQGGQGFRCLPGAQRGGLQKRRENTSPCVPRPAGGQHICPSVAWRATDRAVPPDLRVPPAPNPPHAARLPWNGPLALSVTAPRGSPT